MNITSKWELVVFNQNEIAQNDFNNFTEDKTVRATYMPRYDPKFWEGYTIMEPNQAKRGFTAEEE